MSCFVADLLRWVVVSSTVNFFMHFGIGSSNNKVIKSNHVHQYVLCTKQVSKIVPMCASARVASGNTMEVRVSSHED